VVEARNPIPPEVGTSYEAVLHSLPHLGGGIQPYDCRLNEIRLMEIKLFENTYIVVVLSLIWLF
jgi:hypothetical protein